MCSFKNIKCSLSFFVLYRYSIFHLVSREPSEGGLTLEQVPVLQSRINYGVRLLSSGHGTAMLTAKITSISACNGVKMCHNDTRSWRNSESKPSWFSPGPAGGAVVQLCFNTRFLLRSSGGAVVQGCSNVMGRERQCCQIGPDFPVNLATLAEARRTSTRLPRRLKRRVDETSVRLNS